MTTQIAWTNLWQNKKRTILQLILIAITTSALVLYKGYVDYAKDGMALGFIEKSGNLQIGHNKKTENLSKDELNYLFALLEKESNIKQLDAVLEFSGIIGTENVSSIFWGYAFDNPEIKYGASFGSPVFSGTNNVVLGYTLSKTLGIDEESLENQFVNILTNTNDSGIALASFDISGIVDTGVPQNDSGLVIASRKSIIEFLGTEDTASYLQIFLNNDKFTPIVKNRLENLLPKNYEIKTWIDLNPSFNQINSMNETQYFIISIILCVLVFVSLMQSLSTAFNERLYEFGTLEAIGLKKKSIVILVMKEVVFLSILGIMLGCIFSFAFNFIISNMKIKFIPPGYTEGYLLNFLITTKTILESTVFVFFTCILAMIMPIYHVVTNSVVKLMRHGE